MRKVKKQSCEESLKKYTEVLKIIYRLTLSTKHTYFGGHFISDSSLLAFLIKLSFGHQCSQLSPAEIASVLSTIENEPASVMRRTQERLKLNP